MIFCPRCGSIMLPRKTDRRKLKCSCGYTPRAKQNLVLKEKVNVSKEDAIEIIDKKIETLPKTREECQKCGNKEAYYWTIQTRAGDESETRFFECVKCKHRWRDYS